MTESAGRGAVTALYAGPGWPAEATALLDQSLAPRSPDMLVDVAASFGLCHDRLVLDIGCRDATHALALAKRFGCRVVGVDLVDTWLHRGKSDVVAADLIERVSLVQGEAEALPIGAATCDLVWCRDALSCMPDCGRVLAECARVLRPGGGMVLYAVFATDEFEPRERARLLAGLENFGPSMHQPTVEAAIAAAGLTVVRRDDIGSEWFEYWLEHDPSYLTGDLLHVARLRRARDRFAAAIGPKWYELALAFDQWSLYIVLGKLAPTLYALRKSSGGG